MLFESLAAIIAGLLFGIITGLTPGIHINLVSVIIFSISPYLLQHISPLSLCLVIVSMSVTHTFLDTIPSIFLGAPEEGTILSVLPGHRLLLEGKGYEAVMLTIFGSLGALIISVCFFPLILEAVIIGYPIIQPYIGYILLLASIFLIAKERKSKVWALVIFLMSGCLGIGVLNLKTLKEPLFPLLSGLFGMSMLMLSLKDNTKIPPQQAGCMSVTKITAAKSLVSSVIAGWVCSFMPGLGPAQGAIIASQFVKNIGAKGFLVLVGGLSTTNMVLSFVTFYSINKARSGSVVVISKIIETVSLDEIIIFLAASLIAGGLSTILTLVIAKKFSAFISKVSYQKLCFCVVLIVIFFVWLVSGFFGILILAISTFTGMLPQLKGIGKNHMMGCLLIPVMLYFLS